MKLLLSVLLLVPSIAIAADGITINEGTAKVTAADDISSVFYPRNKIVIGDDGTNDGDVSAANPLPITTKCSTCFRGASASDITNTTATQVAAAPGSGFGYDVYAVSVSNLHATVSTRVDITCGDSDVMWSCPASAVGGGCVIGFPVPLSCPSNAAIKCKASVTGAAVRCAVSGVIASE